MADATQWRSALVLSALVLWSLGACAAPQVTITTEPPESRLFVDGREAAASQVTMPLPYYGTLGATALRKRPPDQADAPIAVVRADLPLEEPVSPWLFPLDFVLEVASAPFRESRHDFVIEVPEPVRAIVPGLESPRLEELRLRAAQARVHR